MANAKIRRQGGFVISLALLPPASSRDPVQLFYCDSDRTEPKLPATHAMMPVGPSEGPGGQHGPLRWVAHRVEGGLRTSFDGSQEVTMVPELSRDMPEVRSHIALQRSAATFALSVTNDCAPEGLNTSFGLHTYFNLPRRDARDVIINGHNLDSLAGEGAAADVNAGVARFWPDYDGHARVAMRHGVTFDLDASLEARDLLNPEQVVSLDSASALGILAWRRRGTPSICLEPTAGYSSDGTNGGLGIPYGHQVTLTTTISLR